MIKLFGSKPRKATLEAVITRADGSVEHLGAIAFYHRNMVISMIGNIWISIKRSLTG